MYQKKNSQNSFYERGIQRWIIDGSDVNLPLSSPTANATSHVWLPLGLTTIYVHNWCIDYLFRGIH